MIHRITAPFREFGLTVGLLYAVDRLLSSLSPRLHLYVYELMVQPIQHVRLLPPGLGRKIDVREIKIGDSELALMPVRPEVMGDRLSARATCLGAFKEGNLIAYMWFREAAYDEDEVRCTYVLGPAKESVFDFDFYVFPDHRMGSAFAALWDAANAFLSRRGIRYTFSRVTRFNLSSRRAHQHLGSKLVARAFFLQVWSLEVMLATLFPYVHVSVSPQRRVRLTLFADVLSP